MKGYKILAMVKKNILSDFEQLLQEGSNVIISKFNVASYPFNFKLVDHKCKINFSASTTVQPTSDFHVENDTQYNFVKYEDVISKTVNRNVAFG